MTVCYAPHAPQSRGPHFKNSDPLLSGFVPASSVAPARPNPHPPHSPFRSALFFIAKDITVNLHKGPKQVQFTLGAHSEQTIPERPTQTPEIGSGSTPHNPRATEAVVLLTLDSFPAYRPLPQWAHCKNKIAVKLSERALPTQSKMATHSGNINAPQNRTKPLKSA